MSDYSDAVREIGREHIECIKKYGRDKADEALYAAFASERVELNRLRESTTEAQMLLTKALVLR